MDDVEVYKSLHILSEQFDKVMKLSFDGILICDKEFNISYFNKRFLEIIKDTDCKLNMNISSIFNDEIIEILIKQDLNEEIISFNEEEISVSKSVLIYFNELGGYCFNFKTKHCDKRTEPDVERQFKKRRSAARYTFDDIVYQSEIMNKCINTAKKFSESFLPILISGESGTGKELFAQSIHNFSNRKNMPFVAINCASLTETLLESELFGYDRGSFTGALREGKIGVFEQAQFGTLFLDEIGDISYNLQKRLLRALQEKQIRRIGSDKVIDIDVRIITATNKNLIQLMKDDIFREDLYYRINTLRLNVPPLRDRHEDILELMKVFLVDTFDMLSEDDKEKLVLYKWPGNVRELKNTAEYFSIMNELSEEILCASHSKYNNDNCRLKKIINVNGKILNKSKLFFEEDNEMIYNKYTNERELISILEIMYENSVLNNGIGRIKLLNELSEIGIIIKEGRLRKILQLLAEKKLIQTYTGSGGSKITNEGIQALSEYKNSYVMAE